MKQRPSTVISLGPLSEMMLYATYVLYPMQAEWQIVLFLVSEQHLVHKWFLPAHSYDVTKLFLILYHYKIPFSRQCYEVTSQFTPPLGLGSEEAYLRVLVNLETLLDSFEPLCYYHDLQNLHSGMLQIHLKAFSKFQHLLVVQEPCNKTTKMLWQLLQSMANM